MGIVASFKNPLQISGGNFPHRAPHPFIHIKTNDAEYFEDYFTEVSDDNASLIGYLPVDVPERGVIEFGYGNEIWGVIPASLRQIRSNVLTGSVCRRSC